METKILNMMYDLADVMFLVLVFFGGRSDDETNTINMIVQAWALQAFYAFIDKLRGDFVLEYSVVFLLQCVILCTMWHFTFRSLCNIAFLLPVVKYTILVPCIYMHIVYCTQVTRSYVSQITPGI
jgi:hypothetical protein